MLSSIFTKPASFLFNQLSSLSKVRYHYSQITKQLVDFTPNFQNVQIVFNKRLQALKQKLIQKPIDQFLRLQIEAGGMIDFYILEGCQGFTYKFKFDNKLSDGDYVHEMALLKEKEQQKRIVFATNGEELKMLKGATLDYAEEMMRSVFYVKQNPNAEISCSCKTSFSPKDYVF